MILNDKQIHNAIDAGEIKIKNFEPSCVQPASYDMRVGEEGFTTTAKERINIREKGFIILEPGDFGVVTTFEAIELPPHFAARIGIRSYYSRKGLFAATGPQIDPGYRGILTIGLINLSPNPISLHYKDSLVSIELHRLNEPAGKPYSGPYQDQMGLSGRDIEHLLEAKGMTYSEILATLRSLSENVNALTTEFRSFEKTITYGGAFMGLILAVMGVFIGVLAFKP